MTELNIRVYGTPVPKGSKKGFVINGRAVVVDANKKTKPWEQEVNHAARACIDVNPDFYMFEDVGVHIETIYYLPRPKSLPKKVVSHMKKPDMDKLDRAVWDALTEASVWKDDSLICSGTHAKFYADEDHPIGAEILVRSVT